MINDELTGTLVLVHPALEHDPLDKQNEIGTIIHTDLPADDVFVRFDDGTQGLYSSDALLTLMPAEEVHRNAAGMNYDTAFRDIKALAMIELFFRYGSAEKQRTAMELAKENSHLQQFCLETLEHRLVINQSRVYE